MDDTQIAVAGTVEVLLKVDNLCDIDRASFDYYSNDKAVTVKLTALKSQEAENGTTLLETTLQGAGNYNLIHSDLFSLDNGAAADEKVLKIELTSDEAWFEFIELESCGKMIEMLNDNFEDIEASKAKYTLTNNQSSIETQSDEDWSHGGVMFMWVNSTDQESTVTLDKTYAANTMSISFDFYKDTRKNSNGYCAFTVTDDSGNALLFFNFNVNGINYSANALE